MPQTYWDVSLSTCEESWRRLRSLRSQPPAGVVEDRLALFSAALEQAEQQFSAAATVGVQSKPLNLFYGLSQAGRAVAAALTRVDRAAALSGHGLRCPGLGDTATTGTVAFPTIQIRSQGPTTTSFRMLSDLLDSAPLETAVRLGDLWAMLPEPELHEPLEPSSRPVLLASAWRDGTGTVKVSVEGLKPGFDPSDLTELLHAYPALRSMQFVRVSDRVSTRQARTRAASS